jgi:hypothetical protein
VTNEEILQEENEVIVRSQLIGTARRRRWLTTKNPAVNIKAIDMHEFRDGKIVRTWRTEHWRIGLHELGAFEK